MDQCRLKATALQPAHSCYLPIFSFILKKFKISVGFYGWSFGNLCVFCFSICNTTCHENTFYNFVCKMNVTHFVSIIICQLFYILSSQWCRDFLPITNERWKFPYVLPLNYVCHSWMRYVFIYSSLKYSWSQMAAMYYTSHWRTACHFVIKQLI